MFELWADEAGAVGVEELVEEQDELLDEEVALVRRAPFEEVEAEKGFGVGGVKENNVPSAVGRDAGQQPVDDFAVRVDEGAPLPCFHVLEDFGLEERGFAGASLADEVGVAEAVLRGDSDGLAGGAEGAETDEESVLAEVVGNWETG
ncbi:MAG: hypothetical protein K0S68_734 [Candidatus Saccharibacteria bacterium]|nr:hypothetical protein [Candidatus Saccharibacteria bacterium]